jgi:hypothetical protein
MRRVETVVVISPVFTKIIEQGDSSREEKVQGPVELVGTLP